MVIKLPDPPDMSARPTAPTVPQLRISTRNSTQRSQSTSPPSPSLTPSSGRVASSPTPRRSHVPRPRNPFILFRCDFVKRGVVPSTVERDHRMVSRIAGERWKQMSDDEKGKWHELAEIEKQQHALKYPDYKYKPAARIPGEPRRTRLKRTDPEDAESVRARKLALLITQGVEGAQLGCIVEGAPSMPPTAQLMYRRRSSSCPPVPGSSHHARYVGAPRSPSAFSMPDATFLTPGNDSFFSSTWSLRAPSMVPSQEWPVPPHFSAPTSLGPPFSQLYPVMNSAAPCDAFANFGFDHEAVAYSEPADFPPHMLPPPMPIADSHKSDSQFLCDYSYSSDTDFVGDAHSFLPQQNPMATRYGIFISNTEPLLPSQQLHQDVLNLRPPPSSDFPPAAGMVVASAEVPSGPGSSTLQDTVATANADSPFLFTTDASNGGPYLVDDLCAFDSEFLSPRPMSPPFFLP